MTSGILRKVLIVLAAFAAVSVAACKVNPAAQASVGEGPSIKPCCSDATAAASGDEDMSIDDMDLMQT